MYIPRYTRYVVVVVVVADAQYLGSAWISFFVNATTRQLCCFFFDASETPHRCTPIQYLACIECSTTVAIKFAKPNTSCEEEATIRGLCKDTHTHMRTDASGCERRGKLLERRRVNSSGSDPSQSQTQLTKKERLAFV